MDHDDLESMRQQHPAWRLLRADSAPFVATVLHRIFVADNARTVPESALIEAIDDELFRLRQIDPQAYPRDASAYVADWADPSRGWLRKFYPRGSDVPAFDLTPATEKALVWLDSLTQRSFVGTESRLLTLFGLLRQLVEGSQDDPAVRLELLHRRRAELDDEIARVERGEVRVLDDTAVRDRFQQFTATARELLSDFREVEENFRRLDRGVRERIATWEGSRGALLDGVLGDHDAIASSDQGISFQAFWDFLMSGDRQDSFAELMDQVMHLPALTSPDPTLRFVVHDWLKAADSVQVTVAHLSQQLRRFLDNRSYLENRRISELLRSIESSALAARDRQPAGSFTELDEAKIDVSVPMSRRLYEPGRDMALAATDIELGDQEFPATQLFDQFTVDPSRLRGAVAQSLSGRTQVSLGEVVAEHPITHGLSEVVTYLAIADDDTAALFDADHHQEVSWHDEVGSLRRAQLPLVVFTTTDNALVDRAADEESRV